ncbi:AraC family transcriptional regulator, partial [Escherichia coli]|nr:AraC family transcriptional regulator [Escherichia coli]
RENRGVYIGRADPDIVGAATRLLELMADPKDAELIAPLGVEEILIRLLYSAVGSRVAQIGLAESSVHRIAKAVNWLRA